MAISKASKGGGRKRRTTSKSKPQSIKKASPKKAAAKKPVTKDITREEREELQPDADGLEVKANKKVEEEDAVATKRVVELPEGLNDLVSVAVTGETITEDDDKIVINVNAVDTTPINNRDVTIDANPPVDEEERELHTELSNGPSCKLKKLYDRVIKEDVIVIRLTDGTHRVFKGPDTFYNRVNAERDCRQFGGGKTINKKLKEQFG